MDHLVIVLTYNRIDQAKARMVELVRHYGGDESVSIVLFDNGSTNSAVRLWRAEHLVRENGAFTFLSQQQNAGFAGGFNEAVRQARAVRNAEVLHLVSDDVLVGGKFIAAVETALIAEPKAVVCHRLVAWQAGWNQFAAKRIPYPDGYYIAMRAETWDALGGFDEDFAPHDYEDVDLGYRATLKGMPLVEIPTMPLMHQPASTIGYGADRYEQTVKMRALFADKHGLTNAPERP